MTKLEDSIAKELLPALYRDLLQPGARQLGSAIESVLSLAPTLALPAKFVSEAALLLFRRHLESLQHKLANVPEEQIITIAPEVGVPVVEKLLYTQDETISEMFLNLLASGSQKGTCDKAHPSFVQIISNLSPLEAQILCLLSHELASQDSLFLHFPILEFCEWFPGEARITTFGPVTDWHLKWNLEDEDKQGAALENFGRLGLIEISFESHFAWQAYEALERHFSGLVQSTQSRHGVGRTTHLGKLFLEACTLATPSTKKDQP